VRLLTGAGLLDATVVKVDAANDLALLSAGGRFAPLPIAASRTVQLGGTVATVGFPDIGWQGLLKERSGDSAERRHFDSSQRRSADYGRKFEDVVKSAQETAVLMLVY
jgi:hypothetical protein